MEKNRYYGTLPAVWQAKWIDPELPHDPSVKQPASVLRKQFEAGTIRSAVLYMTCHGLYEAYLNGQRVGNFVLAPGTGDYRKRLCVQAYDVCDLLKTGTNELIVTLGDGWYRGSVGIDGLRNYYGEDIALLCQLEADGKAVCFSDETWEASQQGPVRVNDLQQGEMYDARKEEIIDWHHVTVGDFAYSSLKADHGVTVREQERFAGKIIRTPNGETVIDFGQNLAGYTEIRVHAEAGQKITLWHGETLDENGNFTQSNFDPGDRNQNGGIPQKTEYICKDGENVYHPSFCMFGFRYAKVETDIDLSDAQFTAIAVYSEMPQTGFFTCGNEDVNRLFLNSLWSMRSNFVDIPTDCPTRERAGWTGDAGVFAPTAVYLADCYPVLKKWLEECRIAQHDDGLVENIAPVNNSGSVISNMLQGSAGWGDACILVPWALYKAYGKKEILSENYRMMKGWMAFCEKRASKTRLGNMKNPYKKYLVDEGFHFGEWCQPDVDNTEVMKQTMMHGNPEVATAYYFRSASLMKQIAEILGKNTDARKYAEIAENAKLAYRYTCTKNGRIESERQCEYVRPLAFGLLDGDEAIDAAEALNELVKKNGYHLNTGFLSTPDLCRVLADHGYTDTAYRLLLQEECPGWLYAVRKGATTIWETWDGIREDGTVHDSLNHYSYGAISGWLFSGVCGIHLDAGRITIKPQPSELLGYAKARWNSPVGTIESNWKYGSGKLILDITVPLEAEIELPDGRKESAEKGAHHYEILL
ncbi:MAG: family 78 glycoside hydrolase catalytic domain [Solobacterium sp.]|nr:family 78 glycoside hydrolase catalytic domain [Solobacterium sp.]